MTTAQAPIPNEFELNLPDGTTYIATQTFIQFDRAAQCFATSMSGWNCPKGEFGIHVWYSQKLNVNWQSLQIEPGCHGNLTVIGNDLYFIWNDKRGKPRGRKLLRWQGVRS